MHIYVIGVNKYNPAETKRHVQCRIYAQKPDSTNKENPNGISVTEFSFQVEETQSVEWEKKVGKFADMSELIFE
jgi:hypothetical protein